MEKDFLLDSYNYNLPEEQIAQFPALERGSSRLLILERNSLNLHIKNDYFENLTEHLPKNAILVANNSRVLPARIIGKRKGGGKEEFLLLTPLPLLMDSANNKNEAEATCLLRPANKVAVGDIVQICPDLCCKILEKEQFGRHKVRLQWQGDLESLFWQYGSLPLPPYIKRSPQNSDKERYQTCYAKITGSVAAPTAGLHFNANLKESLKNKGFEWQEVTLHVGYGTFSPVRCADIRQHKMHEEYVTITTAAADAINQAKKEGRPIIAVGTTALRCLEGIIAKCGSIREWQGWTNIFIYPGKPFFVVDGLITNFHLPGSSLLMLVSAFAGRKKVLSAYKYAIEKGYKFFSYGDAMLIC